MSLQTPLYERHLALGARMVDFGGWSMPVAYTSQIDEHLAVRNDAGIFDVSHMRVVDVRGEDATAFLRHLLANDVGRLTLPGKALYSCLLNEQGGVIDDLIVYYEAPGRYRLVVNASRAAADIAWIRARASGRAVAVEPRVDLALLAVQGPQACAKVAQRLSAAEADRVLALSPFSAITVEVDGESLFIARTGYTGEDGVEIALPAAIVGAWWDGLVAAGVRPCGLGARDTLRLEAGLNLYGNDMDESTNPFESGLGWTVSMTPVRDFIGRAALEAAQASGMARRLTGVVLEERGVLRSHQAVYDGDRRVGEITSGTYSPSIECAIGFARLAVSAPVEVSVDIRGRRLKARTVALPFVRRGRILIQ